MRHHHQPLLAALLVALLPPAALQARAETAPAPYPAKAAYAPRPLPERIVLTWRGDPATTQAVSWRTDTSVRQAVAEIAIANDAGRELQKQSLPARTEPFQSTLGMAHYHAVEFTALTPDTLYAYRVGDGVNWSEWFHFRTASRDPRKFSFIYFGDAQNDIREHCSRVFREAFRAAPHAAFTLHAGDLVSEGHQDQEWGEWFDAAGWVNATIPVVPTPGNHEYRWAPGNKNPRAGAILALNWRPQFTLPENGPKGLPELAETTYYLDYQGVRIISLNSNVKLAEQAAWLRGILKDNPSRWTIVTFHHPIFSPRHDRDNAALRDAWKPVFDEFKVDLVLTGHDHTYARTGEVAGRSQDGAADLRPGYHQTYDPAVGTVYVVSVSGPGFHNIAGTGWAARRGEDTQLYQTVTIDGDELRFEARTATNRLYDAFTLKKRPDRANELIELLPPERRRPVTDTQAPATH